MAKDLEESRKIREQQEIQAAEAARLAAIAEAERQRRIELERLHNVWLDGLNHETAKSVFIFNSVRIDVHNYLNDSWFSSAEEIYCQEGNITYFKKLLDFHKLHINTQNNVTTFSNGRIFTRSGDRVYGNDGTYFIDPVPAHLNIPINFELERTFQEKCGIASEEIKEKRKKDFKGNAILASIIGISLAGWYVVQLLRDSIFNPKPQMEPNPSELFYTTNVDLKLVRADNIAVGTLNTGSCVYVETSPSSMQQIYEVVVNNGTQEEFFKIHRDFLDVTTSYNLGNCVSKITPQRRVQKPADTPDKVSKSADISSTSENTISTATAYYVVTASQLNLRQGPGQPPF